MGTGREAAERHRGLRASSHAHWRSSQIDLAPIRLARLVKNAGEGFVGELGAKYIEGGLDLGMDQGVRECRSKRFGFFRPATQRLRQRPDETGILLGRLNLNANETACR